MKQKRSIFELSKKYENSKVLKEIKSYLLKNGNRIQKLATKHHKELLGGKVFKSEILAKYQQTHIKVVKTLADNLHTTNVKSSIDEFESIGKLLAEDSVADKLNIEEATDGIIFLKQAIWEKLEQEGFLNKLTTEEFYFVTQTTGTFVDIVVSKIAFTFHRDYVKKKEAQTRQKSEFIALITHELKTPVTSVKAFTQVLMHKFAKSGNVQAAALLGKMDGQLDKLTGLISDLLDVSKIESGKLSFNLEHFDLNEVITEICEEMQRTTEKHKIIKKLDKSVTLWGDRDRIGQVLINLLTNSIKYSPKGGKVIVGSKVNTKDVELRIKDQGVGIPKESQNRVFDQFYRVNGKNEKTFPGLGIGLFVCKEIIERHHGKIWLKSEKDKGSTFYFSLPLNKNS